MNDPMLIRVRRPNGVEVTLRVPGEHWQRVLEMANREFGGLMPVEGAVAQG